jgi:hypothetical protein
VVGYTESDCTITCILVWSSNSNKCPYLLVISTSSTFNIKFDMEEVAELSSGMSLPAAAVGGGGDGVNLVVRTTMVFLSLSLEFEEEAS